MMENLRWRWSRWKSR